MACPASYSSGLMDNDLSCKPGQQPDGMKKVNKQCLLDTPRTVRVSEKTWQVIVRTRRP